MKRIFVGTAFVISAFACNNRCYECRLMQINGPDASPYPNDTIAIDTVETCSRSWVKENNVPEGEFYPQSWRCQEKP